MLCILRSLSRTRNVFLTKMDALLPEANSKSSPPDSECETRDKGEDTATDSKSSPPNSECETRDKGEDTATDSKSSLSELSLR